MTDIEKLQRIQIFSGLSWKNLATKIGLSSPQVFTDIRGGRHGISLKLANRILAALPDIRKEWLMADQEPMTYAQAEKEIPLYENTAELKESKRGAETTSRSLNLDKFLSKAESAIINPNDSMVEYPAGAVILIKRVLDFRLLVPGNNYLVETDEFSLIRRVQQCKDKNNIALYASNKSTYPDGKLIYEPFEIPRDCINRIFSIIGCIVLSEEAKL